MKRASGRPMDRLHINLILGLDDDTLYGATDIAKRHVLHKDDPQKYARLRLSLYAFAHRNGLLQTFDNPKLDANGKPLRNVKGAILSEGRSKKWFGKTWKSHLYDEDRQSACPIPDELVVPLALAKTLSQGLGPQVLDPQAQTIFMELELLSGFIGHLVCLEKIVRILRDHCTRISCALPLKL